MILARRGTEEGMRTTTDCEVRRALRTGGLWTKVSRGVSRTGFFGGGRDVRAVDRETRLCTKIGRTGVTCGSRYRSYGEWNAANTRATIVYRGSTRGDKWVD